MNNFANAFLLVYAALFPIINPIGSAPLFLGLTAFATTPQRNALAMRVALNSLFLLLGSMFIGSHVLEFFGISLPVVRIGGGLIVTAFGWKLLNSETPDGARAETSSTKPVPDPFYPLTMPLTVGPGSIAIAISLGSQRPKSENLAALVQLGGAALAGVLAIVITIYLCYRFAQKLIGILGPRGTHVVVRLSAFILVCIGIQILWSGWSELAAMPH
ncbi:MAG TPA: MarC family protein [Rhizomicrobium sp.]|jgi:multiple antibiotic resistance protein|nr:MarC family protein [Rhizomicrobium sp.]